MQIHGLTLHQFRSCVNAVSVLKYGTNIIVHQDAHGRPNSKDGTPNCTARLATLTSSGPGTRTAANGRHGPYACWHAYRDVLMEVFTRYPDAVIRAGNRWRVTYQGRTGFLLAYPATGRKNIGSQVSPVTMPELCDCSGERYEAEAAEFPMTLMTREVVATVARRNPEYADGWAELDRLDRLDRLVPLETYEPGSLPGSADYVSPAVRRASNSYAASAKLLGEGDKPLDPYVFGVEGEESPPRGRY